MILVKPAPPKQCFTEIDYDNNDITLICARHDRCYFGASHRYNFYLFPENKTNLIKKVSLRIYIDRSRNF